MIAIRDDILAVYDGQNVLICQLKDNGVEILQTIENYHPLAMGICKNRGDYLLSMSGTEKVLSTFNARTGELLSKREVTKRLSKIGFSTSVDDPECDRVIVSDRFGDVYQFDDPLNLQQENAPRLLLGHVSMLTDTLLTADQKYIVTCDRDEKIRISNYPDSFRIHAYLLDHEQYVSTILIPKFNQDLLLSAGGDSYLCVWSLSQLSVLARIPFPPSFSTTSKSESLSDSTQADQDHYSPVQEEGQVSTVDVLKILEVYGERPGVLIVFERKPNALLLTYDPNCNCFTSALRTVTFPDIPVDAVSDPQTGLIHVQFWRDAKFGSFQVSPESIDECDGQLTAKVNGGGNGNDLMFELKEKMQILSESKVVGESQLFRSETELRKKASSNQNVDQEAAEEQTMSKKMLKRMKRLPPPTNTSLK